MKNTGRILGILLLLAIAGNGSLSAQRGMRGMRETTRADSLRAGMNDRRMRNMDRRADSLRMRDIREPFSSLRMRDVRRGINTPRIWRMQPGQMRGMRGIRQMPPRFNMRRGTLNIPADPRGRSLMDRNRRGVDSTLNFTEEQKKEIADLRKQQQDEMNILREEMSEKIRILREKQRDMLLEKLTDEQKKAFESGFRKIDR